MLPSGGCFGHVIALPRKLIVTQWYFRMTLLPQIQTSFFWLEFITAKMARLTDLCEDIIRIIVEFLAGPVDPITDALSGMPVVAGSNFSKASLCAAARAHPIFSWMASPIIFRTIELYLGKNRPSTLPTKYAIRERGLRKLCQVLAAGTDRSRQLQTYIRVVDASWVRCDLEAHVKQLLDMAPNLQDLTLRNPYGMLLYLDFIQMSRLQRANLCVRVTHDHVANLAVLPNLEFLTFEFDIIGLLASPPTYRQSPKRTPLACLDTGSEYKCRTGLRWTLERFHGTKKLCTTLAGKKSLPAIISDDLNKHISLRRNYFTPFDKRNLAASQSIP